MKTTKFYIVVFFMFLLSNVSLYAQYNGSNADGATTDNLSTTFCSTPAHFYAYFGGTDDGTGTETLNATTCGTPAHYFAYFGGTDDGAAVETTSTTTCGIPAHFYAYFGGTDDGAATETISATTCAFPPQFYAYFGGSGDGFSLDKTAPICPTQPPVASFTASATEICVSQSVTFTDTSTNIPAGWTWTVTGGTPNSATVQNPVITYNTAGTYTVTLVAANYNGTDTITLNNYINVYAYPVVTSTTPASRCDAGTVILNATTNVGTLNWYATATGGSVLDSGTNFTTPSIAATTTYYVESINGVCNSTRLPVIATVNTTPTITSTTPASRCDTGSVLLNATSSAGSTVWYANATSGTALATTNSFSTPSISTTTTYYVEATTGSCTSPRTAVIATVNTTPIITSTTPNSRCDSGTVTLSATADSGTINWYANSTGGSSLATGASFTTPNISVSTTYYVEASNGNCTSVRTAVTATVNATPTITSTTPSSRCDAGTVTLSASASAGSTVWYANSTGGTALATTNSFTTPSISITTTYYVEAVNGSCASGTRTAVIATVNTSPTITSTSNATVCGQGGGTLFATASAGTVNWYNVPTSGSVITTGNSLSVSGGSGTYYAEAVNNGCISARVAVNYTYIPIPQITVVGSASRCGNGSLTLTTNSDSGTISWYDAPVGGNSVATGTSFTTPSLSSTTSYYVEASNSGCTSARTAVTATVNVSPTVTSTTPNSRCDAGSVNIAATIDQGAWLASSYNWYDLPTGGTAIGHSNSFITPSINVTTTYYIEASFNGCISSRIPVVATINVTPTVVSTTPDGRCGTGTVTLGATASSGTLNWYANSTGGSVLGSGNSFITPTIGASTVYYVEATNSSCTSSRIPVIATVTNVAAPTASANQTFCSGETVQLIVASGTNIIWYDAPSSGNVIPTGTELVSGTTYYGSQTVSGCESSTRIAVTMTLGGCLGTESFDFNQIQLYPNPVSDVLRISSSQVLNSIEVIDMLGRTLLRKNNATFETEIDMSNLPVATYLIQIKVDDRVKTYKIIKK